MGMPAFERHCGEKSAYVSQEEARCFGLMFRYYWNEQLEAYRCLYCGWWHLGHGRKEERGKRREG